MMSKRAKADKQNRDSFTQLWFSFLEDISVNLYQANENSYSSGRKPAVVKVSSYSFLGRNKSRKTMIVLFQQDALGFEHAIHFPLEKREEIVKLIRDEPLLK